MLATNSDDHFSSVPANGASLPSKQRWLVCSAFLSVGLILSGCGGGGGSSTSSNADKNPWLSQLQTNVVGSNAISDLSGIRVPDLSDCQSPAPSQPNAVPMCVDNGPIDPASGQNVNAVNRPFVTIRLCVPGSTTRCVNVNHMLIDTGSTGIRVAVPSLSSRIELPAVTTRSGAPVAECMHFVSGWTWGSLNRADVYIGGMVARNMPIQMMDSSNRNPTLGGNGGGAFPDVPTACSAPTGNFQTTPVNRNVAPVAAIGANGILGVGVWPNDALLDFDQYFVCNTGVCVATNDLDPGDRPSHPSMHLPSFSGGVALQTPPISSSGGRNVAGQLTFGVASLPSGINRLVLDASGTFTTIVNGQVYPYSYIDSGTTSLFFDFNATRIPECRLIAGIYCPASSLRFTATQSDNAGNNNGVAFNVINLEDLILDGFEPHGLNNVAGPTYDSLNPRVPQRFAWGFAFFYGRTVYSLMLGTPLGGTYGTVAYTNP